MSLEIAGAPITNQHVVMGYVQFQDPEVTGRFQSFTCATRHWREGITDIAKWYDVKNFYGSTSLAGLDNAYDHLNADDFVAKGPWRANTSDPEYQYLSAYSDGKSI